MCVCFAAAGTGNGSDGVDRGWVGKGERYSKYHLLQRLLSHRQSSGLRVVYLGERRFNHVSEVEGKEPLEKDFEETSQRNI